METIRDTFPRWLIMEKQAQELLPSLNSWWSSTLGQLVIQVEMEKLVKVFPGIFGYHILLLGIVIQFKMIEYSVIPYQSVVNPFHKDNGMAKTVTGRWDMLPFANNSVDVVVLPHTLDFAQDSLAVIEEAYRVLIPEGRLLLFGFNPYSLWRLKSWTHRKESPIPLGCDFKSLGSIKKELHRLEFQILEQDHFLFQPPMKNIQLMEKLGFLNKLSRFGLKGLSGVYFIEAQKKVQGVRTLHLHRAQVYNKLKAKNSAVTTVNRSEEEVS